MKFQINSISEAHTFGPPSGGPWYHWLCKDLEQNLQKLGFQTDSTIFFLEAKLHRNIYFVCNNK